MASVFRTSFKPSTRTITWTLSSAIFDMPCGWKDLYTAPKFSFAGLDWEIGCEPTRCKGLEKAIFLSVRVLSGTTLAKATVRFQGCDDKDHKLSPAGIKRGKSSVYSHVSFEKPLVLHVPPEKRPIDCGAALTMIFTIEVLAEEAMSGRQQNDSWGSATSNLMRMEQQGYGFDLEIVPASGDPFMVYKMFWTFQSKVITNKLSVQPSKSSLALPFSRKSLDAFTKWAYYSRLPEDLLLLLELAIVLQADELLNVLRTTMSKSNSAEEALRYLQEFKRLKVKPPEVLVSVALQGNRLQLVPIFSEIFDRDARVHLEMSPITQVTKLATPEKNTAANPSMSQKTLKITEKACTDVWKETKRSNLKARIKDTKLPTKSQTVISPVKDVSLLELEDSESDDYGLDKDLESIMKGETVMDSPHTEMLPECLNAKKWGDSNVKAKGKQASDILKTSGSGKAINCLLDPENTSSMPFSKRNQNTAINISNTTPLQRIVDDQYMDADSNKERTSAVTKENIASHTPLRLSHSSINVSLDSSKVTAPLHSLTEKENILPLHADKDLDEYGGNGENTTIPSSTANSAKPKACLESSRREPLQEIAQTCKADSQVHPMILTPNPRSDVVETSVDVSSEPTGSRTSQSQELTAPVESEFSSKNLDTGGKSFLVYKRSKVRSDLLKPEIAANAPIYIKTDDSQNKLSSVFLPHDMILPLPELTSVPVNQLANLKSSRFFPISELNKTENWSLPMIETSHFLDQMSSARMCPRFKIESQKSCSSGEGKLAMIESKSCLTARFDNECNSGLDLSIKKQNTINNSLHQIKVETCDEEWKKRLLRKIDEEKPGLSPSLPVFTNVSDTPALPTLNGSSELLEHPTSWSSTSVGVPLNALGIPLNPYLNKQLILSAKKVTGKCEQNFGIPTDVCKSKLEVDEGKDWLKPTKSNKRALKSKPCLRKAKTRSTKMKWRSKGKKTGKKSGSSQELVNCDSHKTNPNPSIVTNRTPFLGSKDKLKCTDNKVDCPSQLSLPSSKRISKVSESESSRKRSGSSYSGYKSSTVTAPRRYKKRFKRKIDPSCTKCTQPLEKLRHTCKRRRLLKTDILAAAANAIIALSKLSHPPPLASTCAHPPPTRAEDKEKMPKLR